MKIRTVEANNRKGEFRIVTYSGKAYPYPYAKAEPRPESDNRVAEASVDRELAREAFTYILESGDEGSIHVDQVLEYNAEPSYLRELLIYKMTVEARRRVEESGLSRRELARRLSTSVPQLYRLLDPANTRKSMNQLISLLQVLGCNIDLVATDTGSDLWQEPILSPRAVHQREALNKAIRLAQEFEAAYRPRRVEAERGSKLIYVTYAHLIRAIELSRAIFGLRGSPVQYVLIRVLCETYINLRFIEFEPERRAERAASFHDFWDVNRWQLLREVGRRFPSVLQEAGTTDAELKAKLDPHRTRFLRKQSQGREWWDWEELDVVSRVEAYAKRSGDREVHARIAALYRETNPAVHSGMLSLMDSLVAGAHEVKPRLVSEERPINASVLAAALLVDLLATCTRIFECSDFDERIESLSRTLSAMEYS